MIYGGVYETTSATGWSSILLPDLQAFFGSLGLKVNYTGYINYMLS